MTRQIDTLDHPVVVAAYATMANSLGGEKGQHHQFVTSDGDFTISENDRIQQFRNAARRDLWLPNAAGGVGVRHSSRPNGPRSPLCHGSGQTPSL